MDIIRTHTTKWRRLRAKFPITLAYASRWSSISCLGDARETGTWSFSIFVLLVFFFFFLLLPTRFPLSSQTHARKPGYMLVCPPQGSLFLAHAVVEYAPRDVNPYCPAAGYSNTPNVRGSSYTVYGCNGDIFQSVIRAERKHVRFVVGTPRAISGPSNYFTLEKGTRLRSILRQFSTDGSRTNIEWSRH